jgi:subtilisin family serine protease
MDYSYKSKGRFFLRKYAVVSFGLVLFLLSNASNSAPTKKIQFKKSQAQQVIFNKLKNRVQTHGSTRVIVELNVEEQQSQIFQSRAFRLSKRQRIKSTRERLLQRVRPVRNGRVKQYKHFPYVSMAVNEATLDKMLLDPDVNAVYEDKFKKALLAESTPLVGATTSCTNGYCGQGQTIAILDTGVDADHAFLDNKVIHQACFSTIDNDFSVSSLCPNGQISQIGGDAASPCVGFDGCDHGTHVAGIAAGDGTTFSGVAPEADIMAIQVFSSSTDSFLCDLFGQAPPCIGVATSDEILGLDHVLDQKNNFNIASVNLSLGGGSFTSPCDSELEAGVINSLKLAGIATVAASGNEFTTNAITSPACISDAISVGSTNGFGTESSFSNSASFLDLLAPGENITSSVPGGVHFLGGNVNEFDGTSMATPHVAGAFAVMRSANPNATVDEILNALKNTGVSVTIHNGQSKPRIQIDAAIAQLSNLRPTVSITSPTDGDKTFIVGENINFNATAIDTPDGNISGSIQWSSDIDGVLGTGASIVNSLTNGIHTISASVTDSSGITTIEKITIPIQNDSPSLQINLPLVLDQGNSETITSSLISGIDPDDISAGIIYTLIEVPEHGQLEFSDNLGSPISSFTQADINSNRVIYVHDDSEPPVTLGFPSELLLSNLNGTNGFTINGIAVNNDASGGSVSSAGDVNGDGYDDFVIGGKAPFSNDAGKSYVVFGSSSGFPSTFELSNLNGVNGFRLDGSSVDNSGVSVSGAGDVNGDGFDDVIIGASHANTGTFDDGQTYVVFGSNVTFPAVLNLSSLNGTNGFSINGIADSDFSGESVSTAGDVNGDGFADIIIGAPQSDVSSFNSGQSYVVFGSDEIFPTEIELSDLDGTNGFAINAVSSADYIGREVSSAGDINDDGYDDIVIGGSGTNHTYIIYGKSSGFPAAFKLSQIDGSNGFVFNSNPIGGNSFPSVSNAGDVNDDNIDDLIIGKRSAQPNGIGSGQSYIIFGNENGFPPLLDYSVLNGSNGFILNGVSSGDASGSSVSLAGDVDRDGINDIIIGALGAHQSGSAVPGESYVVFGKSTGFSTPFELSTLDGTNGFSLKGIDGNSGASVSGTGDVNNDGLDDVIIGAPLEDPNAFGSGQSYVVYGSSKFADGFTFSLADGGEDNAEPVISRFNITVNDVLPPPDADGDGIGDPDDNCPITANPDQTNTDADDQGDACDADDDNDGLPDSYENSHTFLNPLDPSDAALDQDGDGFNNFKEFIADSDPDDVTDFPLATMIEKILAGDGDINDYFGSSLAIDGDVALVGAPGDDDNGGGSGSAYIFQRDGSGNWGEQAKLTASDGASGDNFGHSVSVAGNVALVGVYRDGDNGTQSGSVYVYSHDGSGNWTQQAKLIASDGAEYDFFGYSVSIDGDTALMGAYADDDKGNLSGSVYIFQRDGSGNWVEQSKLTASDGAANHKFGFNVAIDGDVALVGAIGDDDNGSASGSVYVFQRDGLDNWIEQSKLTASDGAVLDFFGYSVAVAGNVALVGAYGDDDKGSVSGSAYVYSHDGFGNWTQQAKLTASDGAADDFFGYSVDIVVNTALIGAYGDDDNGNISGSAYFFQRDGSGNWLEQAKLIAEDGAINDNFGFSVALFEDTALLGARYNDNGSSSGSAYVYILIDEDGDGVQTDVDNCPIISNPTQTNTDGDSQGDECDSDDDNDGVLDINDAFPLDAAETADTDGDGTGDNTDTTLTVSDGDISFLVAAINLANDETNNPGLDIIELATGGTYQLTSIEDNSFGNSGLPAITSEIIIKGNGASILGSTNNNTCDGSVGDEFRVLLIDDTNGTNAKLTLNNTTVSDGCVLDSSGGGIAVTNGGSLKLNNSAVINSTAQSSDGIYSNGGTITISR